MDRMFEGICKNKMLMTYTRIDDVCGKLDEHLHFTTIGASELILPDNFLAFSVSRHMQVDYPDPVASASHLTSS